MSAARPQANITDQILTLAQHRQLRISDHTDLVSILDKLTEDTELNSRLFLVLSEILGPLFRYDRHLATAAGDQIIDVTPIDRS